MRARRATTVLAERFFAQGKAVENHSLTKWYKGWCFSFFSVWFTIALISLQFNFLGLAKMFRKLFAAMLLRRYRVAFAAGEPELTKYNLFIRVKGTFPIEISPL
jgi:hypothetical protein